MAAPKTVTGKAGSSRSWGPSSTCPHRGRLPRTYDALEFAREGGRLVLEVEQDLGNGVVAPSPWTRRTGCAAATRW